MSLEQQPITAWLVDVDTRDSLSFQYNPNDITDDKTTNYATIKIPGMSHPRYQFVAGEARKISFKVSFFKEKVKDRVLWLQARLYPEHTGTMLRNAPHRVMLIFGDLYPGLICVVRGVKARYFHMFDQGNLLPLRAEVDLSLEEFVEQSVNSSELAQ